MYNPDGSVYRDYPRSIQSTALGSPPGIRPSKTIPKSLDKQNESQNLADSAAQKHWHASVHERIIVQLLKIQPSTLFAPAKLQTISSVQLALLALVTLTDDDPTGIINGDSSTDPTTMEE